MNEGMYACMHVCMYACMYSFTFVYICVYVRVPHCMYIHLCYLLIRTSCSWQSEGAAIGERCLDCVLALAFLKRGLCPMLLEAIYVVTT